MPLFLPLSIPAIPRNHRTAHYLSGARIAHTGHGFICWQNEETCLRTRMNEINKKEDSDHDDQRSSE